LQLRPEKAREDALVTLEREINLDFQHTMNKITFDTIVTKAQDTFAFVTIPPKKVDKIPAKGCISDIPVYDFDTQLYNLKFVALVNKEEAVNALCKVRVECNKVTAMSLFQIPNKYMKLDEFEQTQNQQISQIALYLKDSWINTLKTGIRTSFMDLNKGWFNIKETDFSVYQISKLKKFMELVKFEMQVSSSYLSKIKLTISIFNFIFFKRTHFDI
jgi:dynein heavy chain